MLARANVPVIALDADPAGSDQPMSTHLIHPYGMQVLEEIGLAERVRELAPSIDTLVLGLEDHRMEIAFAPGHGASCPRRSDLDAVLVQGAREAGADVRFGWRVVDVIREGERVVGVVAKQGDTIERIRASLVVGADGRSSTVADRVGAEQYEAYESSRFAYWAYWPRPTWYASDPRYRGAGMILHRGREVFWVFPANRDQLLVGFAGVGAEREAWRAEGGEPIERLTKRLHSHAYFAPLVEARPLGDIVGIVKASFFFRQAAGPGWALVGDAGLFKDPLPALGISDALRDARALARAIIDGGASDAALRTYWRQRDVASIELFEFAKDAGDLDYNNPLNRLVFAKGSTNAALPKRFVEVLARRLSPFEVVSTGEIVRWTVGALLRGRFDVLKPFFTAGKRMSQVKKELARFKQLAAAEAQAALPA